MTDDLDQRAARARAELADGVGGGPGTVLSGETTRRRANQRRARRGGMAVALLVLTGSLVAHAGSDEAPQSTVLADRPGTGIQGAPQLGDLGDTSSTTTTALVEAGAPAKTGPRPTTTTSTPRPTTMTEAPTTTTAPPTTQPGPAPTTTTTTLPVTPPTPAEPCGPESLPRPTTAALNDGPRAPGGIVYIAWEPGGEARSSLWRTGPYGSPMQLTEPDGVNSYPSLSRDETKIVWIHDCQVVTMDWNGRNIRQLTGSQTVPHPDYGSIRSFAQPRWSSDGTMIAVAEQIETCCDDRPQYRLLVMKADGTDQRYVELRDGPAWIDGDISWWTWSSSTRKVLVRSAPTSEDSPGFFVIDIDNGSAERMYTGNGSSPQHSGRLDDDGTPLFVEAGSRNIAFIEDDRLTVMRSDGSQPRVIVSGDHLPPGTRVVPGLRWWYDGLHLVFTTRTGDDMDLWWVNLDGTELRNLTADPTVRQSLAGAF